VVSGDENFFGHESFLDIKNVLAANLFADE